MNLVQRNIQNFVARSFSEPLPCPSVHKVSSLAEAARYGKNSKMYYNRVKLRVLGALVFLRCACRCVALLGSGEEESILSNLKFKIQNLKFGSGLSSNSKLITCSTTKS